VVRQRHTLEAVFFAATAAAATGSSKAGGADA
jgi:hypothetical protein